MEMADPAAPKGRVSRRAFIRNVSIAAVSAPVLLDACSPTTETPSAYEGSPSPAIKAQPPGVLRYFTPNEAGVIGALLDDVIPGAPGVPSASEAGVLNFIDQRLSTDEGVPTYTSRPFAKAYSGPKPPGPDTDQVIWVPSDQLYRYGVQEVELTSGQVYRRGVELIDGYCQKRFGRPFMQLSKGQQGAVWLALSNGKVNTFVNSPTSSHFLEVLSGDAAQGWLADPMYGGNRDMSVWKAIGYPGVQRAYTPEEMRAGRTTRKPQSFSQMSPTMPGMAQPGVLLPESGKEAGSVTGPGDGTEFQCRTTTPA
jgi:gluconate 2-dehydrogenase gamma chain